MKLHHLLKQLFHPVKNFGRDRYIIYQVDKEVDIYWKKHYGGKYDNRKLER